MLDFRINTFLCVCQTMNYTKAAAQLNITQPAVSSHIHYLEDYYGTSLFLYRNKKLYLTRQGEILKERLQTMQNDEVQLKQELRPEDTGIKCLSFGVTMTVGEYAVVNPLAGFLKRHPDMNIHLKFGNTEQLIHLLEDGKIHLALVEGYYPGDQYENLTYNTEDYIAVCAAEHVFRNGTPACLRDLQGERLLIREKGSGTREIMERSLSARGIRLHDFSHFIEVENMHTITALLKEDCGISFLYKIAVKEELHNGRLHEIKLRDFSMQHDLDFIWEKGSIYAGQYRRICEELIKEK